MRIVSGLSASDREALAFGTTPCSPFVMPPHRSQGDRRIDAQRPALACHREAAQLEVLGHEATPVLQVELEVMQRTDEYAAVKHAPGELRTAMRAAAVQGMVGPIHQAHRKGQLIADFYGERLAGRNVGDGHGNDHRSYCSL